jgi:hypothetical protein
MTKTKSIFVVFICIAFLSALLFTSSANADVTWQVQNVDPAAIRFSLSLALDSKDSPHIVYVDAENGSSSNSYSGYPPNPQFLKYASWNDSGWVVQTVVQGSSQTKWLGRTSNTALVIDSQDVPHIAYTDAVNNVSLNYAKWAVGGWSIQKVDDGDGGSIALDSTDNPCISYANINGALKYANWNGLKWTIQTIDPSANLAFDSPLQSLALDFSNNPNIIYANSNGSLIKWAYWNNTSWTVKIVAKDSGSSWLGNVV